MTSLASSSASAPRITPAMWRATIVIAFGAFLSGLDASIVNIGLETMTTDLAAPLSRGHWITTGYLLAMAVSLPAAGWLGRRFGAGRVWLCALMLFTAFSVACATAGSLGALVVGRVAQGAAGGVLIPSGQTVIGQVVGADRMGRVMATLGVVVTLAPALGPVVGGLILDQVTWSWLFWINLPIGAVAVSLGLRHVPRGTPDPTERLDVRGLLMLSAGMPSLLFGLTGLGDAGRLTASGGVLTLVGVLALAAYVRHQRAVAQPILRLALLRRRSFRIAVGGMSLNGAGMLGMPLLLPLWLQVGQGYGPGRAGTMLMALGLGTAVTLPLVGRAVDRHGSGPVAVTGATAVAAAGTAFVLFSDTGSTSAVVLLLFGCGAALAIASVPVTVAAYTSVEQAQLPDATTQVNIAHRLGGATGVAVVSIVLSHVLASDGGGGGDDFAIPFAVMAGVGMLSTVVALRLRRSLRLG